MWETQVIDGLKEFLSKQTLYKVERETGVGREAIRVKIKTNFKTKIPLENFIRLCAYYGIFIHELNENSIAGDLMRNKIRSGNSYKLIADHINFDGHYARLQSWHTGVTKSIRQFVILYKYWHEQTKLQENAVQESNAAQSRLEQETRARMG